MIDLTKIILFRLASFLQAADLVPAIIALRHGENELAGFLRAWQGQGRHDDHGDLFFQELIP